MTPRPPPPTLFPYTTLFRSPAGVGREHRRVGMPEELVPVDSGPTLRDSGPRPHADRGEPSEYPRHRQLARFGPRLGEDECDLGVTETVGGIDLTDRRGDERRDLVLPLREIGSGLARRPQADHGDRHRTPGAIAAEQLALQILPEGARGPQQGGAVNPRHGAQLDQLARLPAKREREPDQDCR